GGGATARAGQRCGGGGGGRAAPGPAAGARADRGGEGSRGVRRGGVDALERGAGAVQAELEPPGRGAAQGVESGRLLGASGFALLHLRADGGRDPDGGGRGR